MRLLQWMYVLWLVPGLLSLTACKPVEETDVQQEFVKEGTTSQESDGGVELNSNIIRAHVRFTNQNPEILQMMNSEGSWWNRARGEAKSQEPRNYSAQIELTTLPNVHAFDFDLSVEAAAGGAQGILYEVTAMWGRGGGWYDKYVFQPRQAWIRPRSIQPNATEIEFEECAGVIRFLLGTDETCQTLIPVQQIQFEHSIFAVNGGSPNFYAKDGSSGKSVVKYQVSAPSGSNIISRELDWSTTCDEIVTVCTPMPPGGGTDLARIRGPLSINGETLLGARWIRVDGEAASRIESKATSPLESPLDDPSSWWTMEDLPPGRYNLDLQAYLRRDRESTFVRAYTGSVDVPKGETYLVREIDGEARYPLVMRPAYLEGTLRFADPYVRSRPGTYSSLMGLHFASDRNHDGMPDGINGDGSIFVYSTLTSSGNSGSTGARISSTFPGTFQETAGEFASSYEQVLVSPYDIPLQWTQESLRLGFWTQGFDIITKPGEYDDERFRYGSLILKQPSLATILRPGERFRIDHEYCFNEIQIDYSTNGLPFVNPAASIEGNFQGMDWNGREAQYTVSGLMKGIPAVIPPSPERVLQYAQTTGTLRFALPQGSFTVRPEATSVNPDGTTSTANFQPFQMQLGCGQRVKVVPPLALSLDPLSACSESASTTVTGQVHSTSASVDRIWYQLNGGPEMTICTQCGKDPVFSFPVRLAACRNTVQVYALTQGMPAPAFGFQDIVWDDPVDGPSCADSNCITEQPACTLVRLSDHNLFLLEDYNQGADVEGSVAAGGNITLNHFSVGHGLPATNTNQVLVAGGDLALSNGGVWGDASYRGSYTVDSRVTYVRGTASKGTPIDFTSRGAELRRLSSRLATLPVNGSTVREPWGGIMLRGTDPKVNVFQMAASAFTGAKYLSIDAPAGSLALLNISGVSATFTGFGHSFSGGIDQHGVLFNFVDATDIDAHDYGFWGTVLAPNAHVTFSNGSFDGGIYARSLTGNAEGHLNALHDRDICP